MKIAKRGKLVSILMVCLVLSIASVGTYAYFTDIETVGQNVFAAGTLDLTVNGQNPSTLQMTLGNIAPGYEGRWLYKVKNIGTLNGKLSVEFSAITNNDNGLTNPESAVDSTGGDGEGELGAYLLWNGIYDPCSVRVFGHKVPLNSVGGQTSSSINLNAGAQETLIVRFYLPSNVGDIVQSDSVTFTIIFHLEQAT